MVQRCFRGAVHHFVWQAGDARDRAYESNRAAAAFGDQRRADLQGKERVPQADVELPVVVRIGER